MLEVAQCPQVRTPVRKKAARELAELGSFKDAAALLDQLGEKKEAADLYSRFDPKTAALILVKIGETERAYSLAANLGLGAKIEIYEAAGNLAGLGLGAVGKEKETAIEIAKRLFEAMPWKSDNQFQYDAFALLASIVAVGWIEEAKKMLEELAESFIKNEACRQKESWRPLGFCAPSETAIIFIASRIIGIPDVALRFYRNLKKIHTHLLVKHGDAFVDDYQLGTQLRLAQLLFNMGMRDEALKVMPSQKDMEKLLTVEAEMNLFGWGLYLCRTFESPHIGYPDIYPLYKCDTSIIPEYQEKMWLIPLRVYWESGLYGKFKSQWDIIRRLAKRADSRKYKDHYWFWTDLAGDKVLNGLASKDAALRSELEKFEFPPPLKHLWNEARHVSEYVPDLDHRAKWDFLRPESEIQEREARKNSPLNSFYEFMGCRFG